MPGEFVMTTDAVRGLGNGDLNTGIKNMYSVMSKLEKKERRWHNGNRRNHTNRQGKVPRLKPIG